MKIQQVLGYVCVLGSHQSPKILALPPPPFPNPHFAIS